MAFTYAWVNIADGAIDPDSPLDTALMTAIRNDLRYVYEYVGGGSFTPAEPHNHNGTNSALIATIADGAVSTEAKLAAAVVSQSKLKTSTSTHTVTSSSTSNVPILSTFDSAAGSYGLGSQVRYFSAGTTVAGFHVLGRADALLGTNEFSLTSPNDTGGTGWYSSDTGFVTRRTMILTKGGDLERLEYQERYVSASKPYDLGNGEIPSFFTAVINNATGKVEMLSYSEDPTWANNGPTVINPIGRMLNLSGVGKISGCDAAERARKVSAYKRTFNDLLSSDPESFARVYEALTEPVTMEEKNRDIALFPHPYQGTDLAGRTVVLLDPCGPTVEELWLAQMFGGDSPSDIIHSGNIIIDNEPSGAIGPPGVMTVGCRWKNTK